MMDVLPYTLGIPSNGHSSERNSTGIDLESTAPFVIANDAEYKYNRIRADMIDSWASCYLNQHIATIKEWAEQTFGMGFRTQTYGGSIDTGLCAANVTVPEGETIGFSDQFDGFSMLAAGRDMGGTTSMLTSEFGASFSVGGAYGYAWDDMMKAAYKDYSAGVNSLVFHGYSYMYSPESQWPGFNAFGNSCSGGPAYKAMVIDNETAISVDAMKKLVEFADNGLALVFANQLPCISTSFTEDNTEITALMDTLLEKENVIHVDSTEKVGNALAQLGVVPSADKAEQDTSILPIHRSMEDGEIYFLYNTSEEEQSVTVTMQGDGAPFVLEYHGWFYCYNYNYISGQ